MRRKKVIVFGAGVTGLSAAHELAERSFDVTVIDPDIREEIHMHTRDRGIGGVARSQWSWQLPNMTTGGDPARMGPRTHSGRDALFDEVIVFDDNWVPKDLDRANAAVRSLRDLCARLDRAGRFDDIQRIQLAAPSATVIDDDDLVETDRRIMWFRAQLADDPLARSISAICPDASSLKSNVARRASLENWLIVQTPFVDEFPGEHGYRFFPSFYRHLFDTMQRTPILRPSRHERAIGSVLDNLVPSKGLGFAGAKRAKPIFVPRAKLDSAESMYELLLATLRELNYSLSDVQHMARKLVEYMSSSVRRREKEYERISWSNFIEKSRFSKAARKHVESAPQMLAALRGSASDARTQGSILVQLLLDQLRSNGRPDALLNGPTSAAWFDHWHGYLLDQGVRFRRGALSGFSVAAREDGLGREVLPVVEGRELLEADYYVFALSLPAATKVAGDFMNAARERGQALESDNDFERILRFTGGAELLDQDLKKAAPLGPLQHLSGIQFYFDVELRFWEGHTQYLDSEWGLSSISQPQFWGRQRKGTDAYRSVLSVDIGTWDTPSKGGRTAWECDADTLAEIAWQQIVDHHDEGFRAIYGDKSAIPTPIAYSVDENIGFVGSEKRDATPFLVNRVGQFRLRPGKVARSPTARKQVSRYEIHLGRYVLAGTFMQTYTRVTSMEAANESARHAVNAILQHARVPGDHCAIWDPEDHEVPEMTALKKLDAMLVKEKRPHALAVLDFGSRRKLKRGE